MKFAGFDGAWTSLAGLTASDAAENGVSFCGEARKGLDEANVLNFEAYSIYSSVDRQPKESEKAWTGLLLTE